MKRAVIFFVIVLSAWSARAQNECKDIIYTQEGDKIFFNCCILEVRNVNDVVYIKGNDTLNVRAYAITKDGEYLELVKNPNKPLVTEQDEITGRELYRGKPYAYYEKLFYGSRTRQGVGVFLTLLGVGLEVGGFVIASNQYVTDSELNTAGNLILIGSLMETLGIPLWISGGIRKANNRKAMEEMKKNSSLSLGFNNYGVGMVYRF